MSPDPNVLRSARSSSENARVDFKASALPVLEKLAGKFALSHNDLVSGMDVYRH